MANNVLVIMSDEHAFEYLGCYGHKVVQTPNIDALAAGGTMFTNAYTPSPMCVPARAAVATGRYPHETGFWDSAQPYDGSKPSWAHRLREAGHTTVSIGKLHFRGLDDDNGFSREIIPMHVVDGVGWTPGLLRDRLPDYSDHASELARDTGVGETAYTHYDRRVCARACEWLSETAPALDTSWTAFVSFVAPHYPLSAPEAFAALYEGVEVGKPRDPEGAHRHPVLKAMREFYCYQDFFTEEQSRLARAAYLGLTSFLDHNVGLVLSALKSAKLEDDTLVIYTSDHGELLGNHGLWTKQAMYEEAVGVPLVLSGPGVPAAQTIDAPVSLIDLYPTAVEATGVAAKSDDPALGRSLLAACAGETDGGRTVLSEYHDGGSPTGIFMARWHRWKYIHYVGAPPQLFDLDADPHELQDLAHDTGYSDIVQEGELRLRELLDPEEVNRRAFADQARKIAALGGRAAVERSAAFNHTPVPDSDA